MSDSHPQGHGWVTPLPSGAKARCGGPMYCPRCHDELAALATSPEDLRERVEAFASKREVVDLPLLRDMRREARAGNPDFVAPMDRDLVSPQHIWPLVIRDLAELPRCLPQVRTMVEASMRERAAGKPVHTADGADALAQAYDGVLDLVVSLRKLMEEGHGAMPLPLYWRALEMLMQVREYMWACEARKRT